MTKYVNVAESGKEEFLIYFLDSQLHTRDHHVTLCNCKDENAYFEKLEGCNVITPLSENLSKFDKIYLNKAKEYARDIVAKRREKVRMAVKARSERD